MASTAQYRLLVVDDDFLVPESLQMLLPAHWKVTAVNKPSLLDSKMMFHAAMVDMHLTGNLNAPEGPGIIEKLTSSNPQMEVIAISGDLSLDLMEQCLKNGAQRFLAKPLSPDEVLSCLEKIEAIWMMRNLESRGSQGQIRWIGQSRASEEIRKQIASLRGEPGPLLIEGETGTGKEVTFRLLNQQEPNRPAIAVNIASIPENLFESEMFGHVRGAFTGAEQMKVGLTEAAHGGDLFLDEIEALPMSQQVKLLRFLETGEVRKLGAKESVLVKTRVICATNQNLQDLVKAGKFREDLLFRIDGKKLLLPPLRQRTDDIKDLAEFFLALQKPRTNKTLSPEALNVLKTYSWPGNVRELKRICEQLALTCPLPIVRDEDVRKLLVSPLTANSAQSLDLSKGLAKLLEEHEALIIRKGIEQCPSLEDVISTLQISRSGLYKKIKDYQIDLGGKT